MVEKKTSKKEKESRDRSRSRDRERRSKREDKDNHHSSSSRHSKDKTEKKTSSKSETTSKHDRKRKADTNEASAEKSPPRKESKREKSPEKAAPEETASEEQPQQGGGGGEVSLSIAETNKLRLKLGLPPLDVGDGTAIIKPAESGDPNEKVITVDGRTFHHKKPENWGEKKKTESLREKLSAQKEKRRLGDKLRTLKTLGETEEPELDTAAAWVERSRKLEEDKKLAQQRAKALEEMDEEFGVGNLVEEQVVKKQKAKKSAAYSAKALAGMTVQHSKEAFLEDQETVLVLADKSVLDEGEEILVNPTLKEREHWLKNADLRRHRSDYNPYEEDTDEYGNLKEKKLLGKYDEEIEGKRKDFFKIEAAGVVDVGKERQMREMKEKLREAGETSLATESKWTLAREYYTEEEMTAFKKPKKSKKKLRKRATLKADDLLDDAPALVPDEDYGARERGKGKKKEAYEKKKQETEPEKKPTVADVERALEMETIGPEEDLSGVVVEDDAEDELQLVLDRARRLRHSENQALGGAEKVARMVQGLPEVKQEPEEEEDMETEEMEGVVVMDTMSEYCRGLGEIPTYGRAGNRKDAVDPAEIQGTSSQPSKEVSKKKKERKKHKRDRLEDLPENDIELMMREKDEEKGRWVEAEFKPPTQRSEEEGKAEDSDSESESDEEELRNVLGEEKNIARGVGGALKLAMDKGYIQKETGGKNAGVSLRHLEAQRYTVCDKQFGDIDDKYAKKLQRMGVGGGPVRTFEEKSNYNPHFHLTYKDEFGRDMEIKDAFRFQSWKFHGKMPGKRKIEKRAKKIVEKMSLNQMSSTDTPLGTLSKQLEKQRQLQLPYIALSGQGSRDVGTSIKKN